MEKEISVEELEAEMIEIEKIIGNCYVLKEQHGYDEYLQVIGRKASMAYCMLLFRTNKNNMKFSDLFQFSFSTPVELEHIKKMKQIPSQSFIAQYKNNIAELIQKFDSAT